MYGLVIILVALSIVISVFILISYFSNRKDQIIEHRQVVENLTPIRNMNRTELQEFNNFYGMGLFKKLPVYEVRGEINCLSLTINQSTYKEFTIRGIRINWRSIQRLSKKDIGIFIDTYTTKSFGYKSAVKELKKQYKKEQITLQEMQNRMFELIRKYSHKVEFVLIANKAFIVAFDDWNFCQSFNKVACQT